MDKNKNILAANDRGKLWLRISIMGTIIVTIGYLVVDATMIGKNEVDNILAGKVAGLIGILAMLMAIVSVIATHRFKGRQRVVSIFCVLLCLCIALTVFAYSFSGYGSS